MTPTELRTARETLGLTQAEFADALGLGAQARISHMENGGTITPRTALMVQALLQIKALEEALRQAGNRVMAEALSDTIFGELTAENERLSADNKRMADQLARLDATLNAAISKALEEKQA